MLFPRILSYPINVKFSFPDLLEGYEKLCAAAAHVTPALVDLEVEHLRRFSLTW